MNKYFINIPSNVLAKNLTTDILENSNPFSFHKSLSVYKSTPLLELSAFASSVGVGNVFVKDESFRFGLNAFKGLGASYAMYELLKTDSKIKTFCTATDGNHGRAVAWAAKHANTKAIVFVPKDTTQNRIDAIKKEDANVIKVNGNYDEACKKALEVSEKEGWQLIQDTAWEGYEIVPAYIMAGYLTHFIELENSLHAVDKPNVDIVFLQAGVGSWAASAVWYYLNKYAANRPKIVIVEPLQSNGILESFIQGKRALPKGNFETIMAGLNCGIPSSTAWEILKSGVDAVISIDDDFTKQAMRKLHSPTLNDSKIIAGESGAAGIAGLLAIMQQDEYASIKAHLNIDENSRILFFNTEGNTDIDSYNSIVEN
jgi:diaminopropionate ammonia-lyase